MIKKAVKQAVLLFLLLAILSCMLSACGEGTAQTAPTEEAVASFAEISQCAVATVITASDFQENGTFFRFGGILELMKEAGCPLPDCALLGGDYSIQEGVDPDKSIQVIRDKLSDTFPDFAQENAIFVQGNHDNASAELTQTGAYDMGSFVVYSVNEDDFPSGQTAQDVVHTLQELNEFFSGMIDAEDFRPVLVATHVPLHHNSRHDNGYAKYLVDLLNRYGQTLDILVLFGHNHSGAFDDDIGGSVNFIARGETMKVQNPGEEYTQLSGNYSEVTLNFTYMNYGYVGYSNNTPTGTSTNELTVGVIQICPDSMEITRFSTQGEYSHNSIPLQKKVSK